MIHSGRNMIDGVPVDVERKSVRCINIRIKPDGRVHLSIPKWRATLREGEAFLRSKWRWIVKAHTDVLLRATVDCATVIDDDRVRLLACLTELHAIWTVRLGEQGVSWRLRRMLTLWGSCHWSKRVITYSSELARVPRDLVEYVVVHELTHLQAHDHGPRFYALMDMRLPKWKLLRRRLNKRQFDPVSGSSAGSLPHACSNLVQAEFAF